MTVAPFAFESFVQNRRRQEANLKRWKKTLRVAIFVVSVPHWMLMLYLSFAILLFEPAPHINGIISLAIAVIEMVKQLLMYYLQKFRKSMTKLPEIASV